MEVSKTQMAYKKFLLDNPSCNRRFHVSYDDEAVPATKTSIKCDYCGIVILEKKDHPPLKVSRDEIIIKTTKLSQRRTKDCAIKDFFPPKNP